MTENLRTTDRQTKSAIGKSLDVYYRDTARTARMDRLNAVFVGQGALVFDIGAHVGDRTGSFARLGATVVALEPQPRVFRALRLIHGRTLAITLRNEAVGAAAGTLKMYINSANPTISTASEDLIAAADTAQEWQGQDWDSTAVVPVTTLDQLINDFGIPDFIKIDVEGFEHEVLKGVSMDVPLLSFEFTTIQRDIAVACVERMTDLGSYEYNFSLGEDHDLVFEDWVDAKQICSKVRDLPASANSGDIFARRVE